MAQIHPSSIVDSRAQLADDVVVGPFCIIGPDVVIDSGTVLNSHVTVAGRTRIGKNNRIFQNAAVGCEPQDKKYQGEDTALEIGDENVIRENCTISIGTVQDHGITRIGSRNLFMANVHIAHDCQVGSDTILANNVAVAGHVWIEDFVILGGQAAVHQFCHLGRNAMIGGAAGILRDVPPYVICSGNPAVPHGLNLVGLRRHGFSQECLFKLKSAYKALYREGNLVADAGREIEELYEGCDEETLKHLKHFHDFVVYSERGVIR